MRPADYSFTAGPVTMYPEALAALSTPVASHHDPAFQAAWRRTEFKVGQVFGTSNDVLIYPAAANTGLEAAAASLIGPGMPVANLSSGVFGAGVGDLLTALGATVHQIGVPWNTAVSPGAVDTLLNEHPEITCLFMVSCETPSGTVNPCEQIGAIARQHGVLTVVDCVSSLGGMRFDGGLYDVCVAGPQKCLGGPAGLSLISASRAAWHAMEHNPRPPSPLSVLSLLNWRDTWHTRGRFPWTPPVSLLYGLEAACDRILAEGVPASIARTAAAARTCRAGVTAMGLELWPASETVAATCVTAIKLPGSLTPETVQRRARDHGVMISGSNGAGPLVRIGHMGPAADSLGPVIALVAVGQAISDLGCPAAVGTGVDAALKVLGSSAAPPYPAPGQRGRPAAVPA